MQRKCERVISIYSFIFSPSTQPLHIRQICKILFLLLLPFPFCFSFRSTSQIKDTCIFSAFYPSNVISPSNHPSRHSITVSVRKPDKIKPANGIYFSMGILFERIRWLFPFLVMNYELKSETYENKNANMIQPQVAENQESIPIHYFQQSLCFKFSLS